MVRKYVLYSGLSGPGATTRREGWCDVSCWVGVAGAISLVAMAGARAGARARHRGWRARWRMGQVVIVAGEGVEDAMDG